MPEICEHPRLTIIVGEVTRRTYANSPPGCMRFLGEGSHETITRTVCAVCGADLDEPPTKTRLDLTA